MAQNQDNRAKDRVHALRMFYIDVTRHAITCLAAVIVWMVTGGGPFWPIYLILMCVAVDLVQAYQMGLLPGMKEYLPFLDESWEKEQIAAESRQGRSAPKDPVLRMAGASTAPKKPTVKRAKTRAKKSAK